MIFQTNIQIPYSLARHAVSQRSLVCKYETNQVIKALDTWLVLKHISTRCPYIKDWNFQKKILLKICKISEAIFRHRLKLLKDLELLQYERAGNITICSWDQLGEVFNIDTKYRFTIEYTTNDKKRIQEWLIATEILDNQARQGIAIIRKLNKNPEQKKAVISAILKAGGDLHKMNNSSYVLSWLKTLYINDFIQASEIHSLMIAIRPDTNRGVKGIQKAWNCKNFCSISYWKKILQKAGIIDVTKIQIQSFERVRNSECKVLWLDDVKQTLLCLCDQILVLQPWNRINLSFE